MLSYLVSLSVPAEIYKWTDDEGKVHYSEKPPNTTDKEDVETVKIRDNVDTQRANEALKKKSKSLNERREDRKKNESETADAKKQLLENKARCKQLKEDLSHFQHPKVNLQEEDGTVRALGEEERQQEVKNLEKMVKKACDY